MKKKEITYKSRDLFTVGEIAYSDGVVLYTIKGELPDKTNWSSGLHNSTDLIVQVLIAIGKISVKSSKTFFSRVDKEW
jgi:hypothetical protein